MDAGAESEFRPLGSGPDSEFRPHRLLEGHPLDGPPGHGPVVDPGPGDDPEDDDPCPDDVVLDEVEACEGEFARGMRRLAELQKALKALRKEVYDHNLAVSTYEGDLGRFNGDLANFLGDLNSYKQQCQGRTYTTTALNALGNQLVHERNQLQQQRNPLVSKARDLKRAAKKLNSRVEALKEGLKKLRDDLLNFLRKTHFECVDCHQVRVLASLVDVILASVSFSIRKPSGEPADIPTVPFLPMPPHPGSPGWAPPNPKQAPHKTKVILSPPMPTIKNVDSGQVWPYVSPIEGATRFCVSIDYFWSPTMHPTQGVREIPAYDPHGDYILFHHEFKPQPLPTVHLSGSGHPTDIAVSHDGQYLYFTLAPSSPLSAGLADIVIEDGGIQFRLSSPDPKTSLRITDDLGEGLAALEMSLLVAVDSAFSVLKPGATLDEFLSEFSSQLDAYRGCFSRFAARLLQDPDPAGILAQPLAFDTVGEDYTPGVGSQPGSTPSNPPFAALANWAMMLIYSLGVQHGMSFALSAQPSPADAAKLDDILQQLMDAYDDVMPTAKEMLE